MWVNGWGGGGGDLRPPSPVRSSRISIMGGGSSIEGESLLCQLHFQSARKTKKNATTKVVESSYTLFALGCIAPFFGHDGFLWKEFFSMTQ